MNANSTIVLPVLALLVLTGCGTGEAAQDPSPDASPTVSAEPTAAPSSSPSPSPTAKPLPKAENGTRLDACGDRSCQVKVTADSDIAFDHEDVYGIVVFDVKKEYVDLAAWGPHIPDASSTHNVRIGSPDGRDQVETGLPAGGSATISDALTIEVDAVKGKQAVLTISPGVEAKQQFQVAWP